MTQTFTPIAALAGGALLGLAATLLLALTGRIAGVSGIVAGLAVPRPGDVRWRLLFVTGLLAAGAVSILAGSNAIAASPRTLGTLLVGGFLVGMGTRLSSGCTSGHGVCGLSRGSVRSLVATVTFVATGMLTASLAHLLGGGP